LRPTFARQKFPLEARPPDSGRLASLDQFRGYTVLGMFVVNFVGSYAAIKAWLPVLGHHHTYCSYADTIMPQFFFAVGFAYRMTFLRRLEKDGAQAAYWHAFRRVMGLLLVALIVHTLGSGVNTWAELNSTNGAAALTEGLKRDFFQTLTHIAVTSLWVLPVIAARPGTRVLWMLGSAAAFHVLSEAWYYDWVNTPPKGIDGGPLGFLTWTIPLIVGTLAYDTIAHRSPHAPREGSVSRSETTTMSPVIKLLLWSLALMLLGYGLSCINHLTLPNTSSQFHWWRVLVEPPFVPPAEPANIWTMSQRSGSVSYLTFGAGFSLAVYALFVLACDIGVGRIFNPSGTDCNSVLQPPTECNPVLQLGIFRTLGTNALAGYILHDLVAAAVKPWVPSDSPLWWIAAGCGVYLAICYVLLRYLEKHKLFLKL